MPGLAALWINLAVRVPELYFERPPGQAGRLWVKVHPHIAEHATPQFRTKLGTNARENHLSIVHGFWNFTQPSAISLVNQYRVHLVLHHRLYLGVSEEEVNVGCNSKSSTRTDWVTSDTSHLGGLYTHCEKNRVRC